MRTMLPRRKTFIRSVTAVTRSAQKGRSARSTAPTKWWPSIGFVAAERPRPGWRPQVAAADCSFVDGFASALSERDCAKVSYPVVFGALMAPGSEPTCSWLRLLGLSILVLGEA